MEVTEVLIGGIGIISNLYADWIRLCEEGASNHPFLRPEWFSAFVSNFGTHLTLLTVWRGEKLRALLPLENKRGSLHGIPVKKLQAVFNLNTQRFDLIHGSDESQRKAIITALWEEIKNQKGWQVVEMRMVYQESWLKDLLNLAESENYRTGTWEMDYAPYITIEPSEYKKEAVGGYLDKLPKKRRQDLNRRLKRLREQGNVEFVITREYSNELMQTFFDLENRGWKGRGGTAAINDPQVEKLHKDFAVAVAASDALFFYELKLDGKTIAMQLRVKYDDSTVCWKTAYDEEYARFSPGNLLFREFLSECVRNGSSGIDLLCPSSLNKRLWATGQRELVGYYVFQPGFIGLLLWGWKFLVIANLRKLKRHIPLVAANDERR